MELPTLDSNGWQHRAYAEVSAILSEVGIVGSTTPVTTRELMAAAWLQGFNLGAHETLGEAEKAFQRLQEDLSA
jgi:hypothetical protein